jgi:hypothetical protein
MYTRLFHASVHRWSQKVMKIMGDLCNSSQRYLLSMRILSNSQYLHIFALRYSQHVVLHISDKLYRLQQSPKRKSRKSTQPRLHHSLK